MEIGKESVRLIQSPTEADDVLLGGPLLHESLLVRGVGERVDEVLDSRRRKDLVEELMDLVEHGVEKSDVRLTLDNHGAELRDGESDLVQPGDNEHGFEVAGVAGDGLLGTQVSLEFLTQSSLLDLEKLQLCSLGGRRVDGDGRDVELEDDRGDAQPATTQTNEGFVRRGEEQAQRSSEVRLQARLERRVSCRL